MTPTEDDLRSAMRLLEQRGPQERLDVVGGRAVLLHRLSILRLGSAAALVLVVAGGATLLAVHRHGQPVLNDGPIATPVGTPHPLPATLATLRVRVAVFGGPAGPNGGEAISDSPDPGTRVTVVSIAHGRGAYQSQLQITSSTNSVGIAAFPVAPGRYRYRSTLCGSGFGHHGPVTLSAGQTRTVQIRCAVP